MHVADIAVGPSFTCCANTNPGRDTPEHTGDSGWLCLSSDKSHFRQSRSRTGTRSVTGKSMGHIHDCLQSVLGSQQRDQHYAAASRRRSEWFSIRPEHVTSDRHHSRWPSHWNSRESYSDRLCSSGSLRGPAVWSELSLCFNNRKHRRVGSERAGGGINHCCDCGESSRPRLHRSSYSE